MSSRTLLAIAALAAALLSAGVAWAASPGMIATSREVPTACSTEAAMHFALDAIVSRGPHCTTSAHEHVHAGTIGIDSDETYASAIAKPSGFVIGGIHSWGEWAEWTYAGNVVGGVLTSSSGAKAGTAARAKGAAFYYRRKGAPAGVAVEAFPHGFAMVIHEGDVINGTLVNRGGNAATDEILFKCGPGSGVDGPLPPAKCSSNILVDNYVFPPCWNGVFAGEFVDEVRAGNMSYPVNGKCPAPFSHVLPRVEQYRRSDVTQYAKGAATLDPSRFALGGHPVSEPGAAHAGYAALWEDQTMQAFLDSCLNYRSPTSGTIVGRDCGTNPIPFPAP